MRAAALMLIASALASCTMEPPPPGYAAAQAADENAALQRHLAGRVPSGPPLICLPPGVTYDGANVGPNTIIYRRGGTVYVNHPPGGCTGLGSPFYALVTRSVGTGPCRGDIAEVVDVSTNTMHGSCSLGDFVPYSYRR